MLALLLPLEITGGTFDRSATFDCRDWSVSLTPNAVVVAGDCWTPLAVGLDFALPVTTRLVPLDDSSTLADMSVSALGGALLSNEAVSYIPDIVTTSDPESPGMIPSNSPQSTLGRQPVSIIDEIRLDGRRYARGLICPVYLDSLDRPVQAGEISIRLKDRLVNKAELLEYSSIDRSPGDRSNSPAGGSYAQYIIVTNDSLAPAFHRLAEYKSSVGIRTEVRLIEEVTSSYAGIDDAERLRNAIIDWHAEGVTSVLLGGDETVLPVRYALHYATYSDPIATDLQLCDLYFADLTGNWDVDHDGVWGEPNHDQPDLVPELAVGRLPVNSTAEVEAYIDKLIIYETNPGLGHADYLVRSFFFSSDQMRDWGVAGQHGMISGAYPGHFDVDTVNGVEQSAGYDDHPTNMIPSQLAPVLSEGHGIVNILAHGSSSGFVVRSSGYNQFPKAFLQASTIDNQLPIVAVLESNNRTSFYYSLACSNGGFDRENSPFFEEVPNLSQTLLTQPQAGAVGFVGYSRWGWVSTSHYLQTAYFDSLFAHPGRTAVEAMYDSKAAYYYYRDLVYGQNYLGDPTLKVYTDVPSVLYVAVEQLGNAIRITVTSHGVPQPTCQVLLSHEGSVVWEGLTDAAGEAWCDYPVAMGDDYTIAALQPGATIGLTNYSPSIVSDVEDDGQESDDLLPDIYALSQNYPNPFNPSTSISFSLPENARVRIDVINILGQLVTTLTDGQFPAGSHEIEWRGTTQSGDAAASGTYFYRLISPECTLTRKMMLMK